MRAAFENSDIDRDRDKLMSVVSDATQGLFDEAAERAMNRLDLAFLSSIDEDDVEPSALPDTIHRLLDEAEPEGSDWLKAAWACLHDDPEEDEDEDNSDEGDDGDE